MRLDDFMAGIAIVFVVTGALWIWQFVQLMLLSKEDFVEPHDKYVWAAAFLIISPFAPLAFLAWKGARQAMRNQELHEKKVTPTQPSE